MHPIPTFIKVIVTTYNAKLSLLTNTFVSPIHHRFIFRTTMQEIKRGFTL